MQYTTLGRTRLRVSVAGFGTGGNSRAGLGAGKSEKQAICLINTALDLGINFFDTAEAYGTEAVLGRAISGRVRSEVVVSTKSRIVDANGQLLSASALVTNLEHSLRKMSLDFVDVFHLHAVQPQHYDYVLHEFVPALAREKDKGKYRHLGITETPPRDPNQAMLSRALQDSCWEVVMLAFHMLNQRPRESVLTQTRRAGVGTLLMFVVRNIFSNAAVLRETFHELAARGEIPAWFSDDPKPLDFLIHPGGASSLTDAAYRFARHEPGADVVLFGTGDERHLRENVDSILKPALPLEDVEKLRALFGKLKGVGLVFPDHMNTAESLRSI